MQTLDFVSGLHNRSSPPRSYLRLCKHRKSFLDYCVNKCDGLYQYHPLAGAYKQFFLEPEWAIDLEAIRARGIIVLVKSNQLVKNIETKQL